MIHSISFFILKTYKRGLKFVRVALIESHISLYHEFLKMQYEQNDYNARPYTNEAV